jgi:hypothetical protein
MIDDAVFLRDGGAMTVRPLGGLDQDTQLFVPSLEQDLKPARFPPPSAGRAGRTGAATAGRPWRLFQGVHFLPQGYKDANTRRYHQQHRTDKVTEPWRTATKFTGMYHPYGQIFFGMGLPLLLQRQKKEAAIRTQRILLSHGRCFDGDADKVIRRIFREPPR